MSGTVFIVDDAAEIRSGLTRLLRAAGYEVHSFESAERFFAEQDNETPGCLLLDICMPGMSGLDVQRVLVDSAAARPIIFLSGHGDIQTSVQAMKAGAVDFLTKPFDPVRLFAAVDTALKFDSAARRDRESRRIIEARLAALTRRERQVMEQVIRGRLNKQIAADLRIGEKTVKVHRARVMEKVAVGNVPELVRLAARVENDAEPAFRGRAPSMDCSNLRTTSWIPTWCEGITKGMCTTVPALRFRSRLL
jgi:FixJ family two-component response regulator